MAIAESTTIESTEGKPSAVLRRYTCIGLLLFFAFAVGWLVGSAGAGVETAKLADEQDSLLATIEPLQDPVELELIRTLKIGDDLAKLPHLAMLVDEIIGPQDTGFKELYDRIATTEPMFAPTPGKIPTNVPMNEDRPKFTACFIKS